MSSPNPLTYRPQLGVEPPTRMPKHFEPCWCGSGLKFKKCHRDRASESKPNFFAETAAMQKAGSRGRCLHPDAGGGACSSKSIASHTVQRGGGLAAIAEDGHVLTTAVGFADIERAKGKPEPRRVGIRDASTFPGFCNTHDTALFRPIEQSSLSLDAEMAFLFLYRAICLELVRKRSVVSSLAKMKQMDRGLSDDQQHEAQATLRAYERGINNSYEALTSEKADLDNCLLRRDWSNINYCRIELDILIPITTACAFYPELDFTGRRLQDIGNIGVKLADLAFTITSYNGRTSIIFVWRGNEAGAPKKFVESFLAIPDAEKAPRIAAFCFEISENVQMTPSWWTSLAMPAPRGLADKMWNGTTRRNHVASAMADVAPLPSPATVASVVRSWT